VDGEVMARLWELHWRYGYFTRDEIDAALGLDPLRGRWECPGQLDGDGRWVPHCGKGTAA
jgi:hypothetical protein